MGEFLLLSAGLVDFLALSWGLWVTCQLLWQVHWESSNLLQVSYEKFWAGPSVVYAFDFYQIGSG
jgi:hypothetical protein